MAVDIGYMRFKELLPVVYVVQKNHLRLSWVVEVAIWNEVKQVIRREEIISVAVGVEVLKKNSINVSVRVACHHEEQIHLTIPFLHDQVGHEAENILVLILWNTVICLNK